MFSAAAKASALLIFLPALRAGDWPQWRGPERTGHVPPGVAVPKSLPPEPRILWRIKLGDGIF